MGDALGNEHVENRQMKEQLRYDISFPDFLRCQKIAELLSAYQIDPSRVRVNFYITTDDDGYNENQAVEIRSKDDNTSVELDALQRLHTDLGINDSYRSDRLLICSSYADLIALLNPLIEKQNLKVCVTQLSHQAQR